jgi:hypothetical protein
MLLTLRGIFKPLLLNITPIQASDKFLIILKMSFLIIGSHHDKETLLIQDRMILSQTIFASSNHKSGGSSSSFQ